MLPLPVMDRFAMPDPVVADERLATAQMIDTLRQRERARQDEQARRREVAAVAARVVACAAGVAAIGWMAWAIVL